MLSDSLKSRKGLSFKSFFPYNNDLHVGLSLLTLFRPGGLWRPYQTLKLNNFKAVKAMTTIFSDFSYNLSGNILTLI